MKLPPQLQQLLGFQDFDYKSPVFIDRVESLVYNSQFVLDLRKKLFSQGPSMPTPPHANTRQCTHIKVNGIRCGSPALKNEFFCYFHARLIKGVPGPLNSRFAPICNLENPDAVQYSLMGPAGKSGDRRGRFQTGGPHDSHSSHRREER